MAGNAAEHEAERAARLHRQAEKEAAEGALGVEAGLRRGHGQLWVALRNQADQQWRAPAASPGARLCTLLRPSTLLHASTIGPPAEAAQGGRHHTDTAAFLQQAAKEVHGAAGAAGSLADTVGRRKGMSDAGASFRRH